jgi:hypothetical protein
VQVRKTPFFLRIDDVTESDPRLIHIVDGALEWGLPVLVSIIPSHITKAAVNWLLKKHSAFPQLLEIGQHGYRHINYLKGYPRGEFCKTRRAKEQLADLKAGRRLMDDAFGEAWSRIFIPPFNCFTRLTVRLLAEHHYRGVSAMHLPPQKWIDWVRAWRDLVLYRLGGNVPAYRNVYSIEGILPYVSPIMDVTRDYSPPASWQGKELHSRAKEITMSKIPVFGVMIHYWVYRDIVEVEAFMKWLAWVKRKETLVPVPPSFMMDQLRNSQL